jgi:hypothetical protein
MTGIRLTGMGARPPAPLKLDGRVRRLCWVRRLGHWMFRSCTAICCTPGPRFLALDIRTLRSRPRRPRVQLRRVWLPIFWARTGSPLLEATF